MSSPYVLRSVVCNNFCCCKVQVLRHAKPWSLHSPKVAPPAAARTPPQSARRIRIVSTQATIWVYETSHYTRKKQADTGHSRAMLAGLQRVTQPLIVNSSIMKTLHSRFKLVEDVAVDVSPSTFGIVIHQASTGLVWTRIWRASPQSLGWKRQ